MGRLDLGDSYLRSVWNLRRGNVAKQTGPEGGMTREPQEPKLLAIPPPTDARQTTLLWRRVRQRTAMPPKQVPSFAQPTKASERRRHNLKAHLDATGDESPNLLTPLQAPTFTTETHTTATSNPSQRALRVTDRNFRETILAQHAIDVVDEPDFRGAYRHFGTEAPSEQCTSKDALVQWYHTQHGLQDSLIWLSLEPEEASNIAHEYQQMVLAGEEEAKFSFFGKTVFFQQDIAHVPRSIARKQIAYCKMEWTPNPDGRLLRCPPIVREVDSNSGESVANTHFGFTNKLDCTFWLPVVLFDPGYRNAVAGITFMIPKAEVIGPYFTIEFKKEDQDTNAAENQLAAAAALNLFNRVDLRTRRLNKYVSSGNRSWTIADFADLKHYGVAFSAQYARIYMITPRLREIVDAGRSRSIDVKNVWQGCVVEQLALFDVTRVHEVLELRRWVNEIQNWGLSKHSKDLVVDIKGILRKKKGGEERVSLLPYEISKLGLGTGS